MTDNQPTLFDSVQQEVEYRDLAPFGFIGYRVGSDGSVWTRWKRKSRGGRGGVCFILSHEWMRLKASGKPYPSVNLKTDPWKAKSVRVHVLVLTAFVGLCPDKMEGCHNDGNPKNNHLDNLRWGTRKSNAGDMVRHGTSRRGLRSSSVKLTQDQVREIRSRLAGGEPNVNVARDYPVSEGHIATIKSGGSWGWLDDGTDCGSSSGCS